MGKLRLVDVGVTAALTALTLVSLPFLGRTPGFARSTPSAYALAITAAVGTLFRTRWPVPTLGVVTAATVTYLLLAYPYGPVMVCVVVAVYSLARNGVRSALLCCTAAATLALLLVHVFTHPARAPPADGLIPASAIVAVPFSIGVARRMWREARAAERDAAEQQARDDERLQLAHEVHDVVGHGLAAIQMQADIALHLGTPQDTSTARWRPSRRPRTRR